MANNYGLGRGLASLIPKKSNQNNSLDQAEKVYSSVEKKSDENDSTGVVEVEVERIIPNPHQPRLQFDEEKLEELVNSIKQHGIIQPIVVTKDGNQYEIIAGERRFQASKRAGLKKVPVFVRDAEEKDKLELALIENIQRHDLNAIEEAKAYKKLADDFQMSQEEVADKVGKSRSAVANKLRLLNLTVDIQKALIEGRISEGHAKAILAVSNPEKQRALYELIKKENLTVRQIEDKTREISVKTHKRRIEEDPEIKNIENHLMTTLGTRVTVKKSGNGGKIIIDYYSREELNGILEKIK